MGCSGPDGTLNSVNGTQQSDEGPETTAQATAVEAMAVELCDVTMRYGSATVLDEVSLQVPAGRSLAVMGPNGSGKTTLLRLVAGLLTPSDGSVTVAPGQRLAFVTQHRSASKWMPITAGEVVAMGSLARLGWWRRMTGADRRAQRQAAERLEVGDLLSKPFGELSGGQQQRILLAQALVQEPTVLLLDEPITGLDLASQQRILDLVAAETEAGHSVVVTTHNLDEARHCDDVALLSTRLIEHGPPAAVLQPGPLREAFGDRVLGDHRGHDHGQELLMLDDHGHGHDH